MKSAQSAGDGCWHFLRSDGTFLCGSRRTPVAVANAMPGDVSRVCARCVCLALSAVSEAPVANDVVPHDEAHLR